MSENKRYYWLKLKKDFFDSKMIKILKTFERGNEMIITFLKMELHSLEKDGYIYYDRMLPTFEQELAVAIGEETSIVKETLDTLINFGAIKKNSDTEYYLSIIEDCIGSEAPNAQRMRKMRDKKDCDTKASHCDSSTPLCDDFMSHCDTEKEIEKEIEKSKSKSREDTDKKASAFSFEKKSGSFNVQNANSKNNSDNTNHNSTARKKPPRNYEMEEFLKRNNLKLENFMPSFANDE